MRSISQSNHTKSSAKDVYGAIAKPSCFIDIENIDKSIMHYCVNGGEIKVDAIMRYFLVTGFTRVVWTAKIISIENGVIKTSLAKGPFSQFEASHSIVESETGCTLRDFIDFKTDSDALRENLASAIINLDLDRNNQIEQITGEVPLFDGQEMA